MVENPLQLSELRLNKEPYIQKTQIPDVLLIKRPRYADNRGALQELFQTESIEDTIGRNVEIKQSTLTNSEPGVLRGIHAEDQDKIVTPLSGKLTTFIVDLRPNSETFLKWQGFEFDMQNQDQKTTYFVPNGCGHSFCVHADSVNVELEYCVSKKYDFKTADMGVRYDDPHLNIPWPVKRPGLSKRDSETLPYLQEFLIRHRQYFHI